MDRLKWVIALTAVFFYIIAPPVKADYIFDDVDTLRGITSLYVYIHALPSDAKKFGFTEEKVRSDVVSKLEAADIQVLSYNSCCETPGAPYLFIGIGMIPDSTCNKWAFTVHIELRQVVNLEREPDLSYHATTWIRGETILIDDQTPEREVQNHLKGWVNMFTYDLVSANR